jgi:hypothetical protein
MIGLTTEELLRPVFATKLTEYNMTDFDYYVYNNQNFTPVEICLDDIVSPKECLLHICVKDVDPALDRCNNPDFVFNISSLYEDIYTNGLQRYF